jgi:hypothetical protein
MYRISTHTRKYSSTPIVRVTVGADGKEQEEIVCICTGQGKASGDVLAVKIVELLNWYNDLNQRI